ncbi:putative HTH CENPB-type domain-containing protein [Phytophthora infestans]|nr:putative HTH CENPB-type domain-containing protein [Phytophthora infestans]
MAVIPGGLTPYLQTCDVGIFESFKDRMDVLIDAWKRSDQVAYTRGGDPKPLSFEMVMSWVPTVWCQMPDSVVQKSIGKCVFNDDPDSWFITRHNVNGTRFRQEWSVVSLDDQALCSISNNNANEDEVDELLDAFDEVWIEN